MALLPLLAAATFISGVSPEPVAVWEREEVKAGQVSDPFPLARFDSRTLYVAGALDFAVEVDAKGDGAWTEGYVKRRGAGIYDLKPVKGVRIRLVAKRDAKQVTAVFNCANADRRPAIAEAPSVPPDGAASAVVTNAAGCWRFPFAGRSGDSAARPVYSVSNDVMVLAGVRYGIPAAEAGGFAKIRARSASEALGASCKPCGVGGPWKNTLVRAGEPSDPYLMSGFDRKRLSVSATDGARVTVEIDITGTGVWIPLRTASSLDRVDISRIRAYWLRAVADHDCRATVQLEYD